MAKLIAERKSKGHPLGLHRVLDTEQRLPQAADRLDNSLPIYSNEILIDVERLNIDAASFIQMELGVNGDKKQIADLILENCQEKGKQHNRITGSGGMLLGKIKQIGSDYRGPLKVKVGDSVATLVSLTLTPLHIEEVHSVNPKTHQLSVSGHAVLFESGIAEKMPNDIPELAALSVFDVAGAPALVAKYCRPKHSVVIIGAGGKAGILSCFAARQKIGSGRLIGIEPYGPAAKALSKLDVCDEVLQIDARDGIKVAASVAKLTHDKMGDVVVNVASVHDTEMSTVLSTGKKGTAIFFGMATSFTKVALGAEGVASTANLIFGNGYTPGHGQLAIGLLRKHPKLKSLFLSRYTDQ